MSPLGVTVQPATNDEDTPAMAKPIIATESSDEEEIQESYPESRTQSVLVNDDCTESQEGKHGSTIAASMPICDDCKESQQSEHESTIAELMPVKGDSNGSQQSELELTTIESVPASQSVSLEQQDVGNDVDQADHSQRTDSQAPLPEPCLSRRSSKRKKKRKKSLRKRVAFSQVIIRYYEQTLGDNPAVSYGPPIQLDWGYEEEKPQDIYLYESNRGTRRSTRMMILSHYQRTNILCWNYGIPDDEIKLAQLKADVDKRKRSITVFFLPLAGVECVFQSVTRKFRCLKCTSTTSVDQSS